MADKRINIEKSNIPEGKKLSKYRWNWLWIDMRLKAIEYVLQKGAKSGKIQDVDLAKELKKVFDE